MSAHRFDAVVLGAGPAGEVAASRLNDQGLDVALVERELVGGECAYWACIPSKPLLRPPETRAEAGRAAGVAEPELDWGQVASKAVKVTRENGERIVHLEGGRRLAGRELLVGTGRAPRVHGIGLESIGVEPNPHGIEIDERCRAAEGVWAIGDVTGVLPLTHVGMYQGRITAADIAGHDPRADYAAIPRVVFCDPEVAAVGLTQQQARDKDIDVATSRVALADAIARPWTYEKDPRGELGLIADRERKVLVGAWAVAPMAGEWIHYAALAIKTQTPISVLLDTVAQFPTFTEAYLKGVERLGF